jgi:hypothetical protein
LTLIADSGNAFPTSARMVPLVFFFRQTHYASLDAEERQMNLQLASAWLEREHVGFSDIQRFATQCRDGARNAGRESAALVLLGERAAAFSERYEGVAVSTDVVDEFLADLRKETHMLLTARQSSDDGFLSALNAFATRIAPDLV